MRPRTLVVTIVVAALAFAAGIGLGLTLGEGDAPAPSTPERPSVEPTDVEPEGSDRPGPRLKRANTKRPQPDSPPATEPPPSSGTGIVTGIVQTMDGAPLANVVVRADPLPNPPGQVWPGDGSVSHQDVEARVRAVSERERERFAGRSEATSQADGSFALEGLTDREYRLEAFLTGYAIEPERKQSVRPGDSRTFVARPLVGFRLTLRLASGDPPASASVTFEEPGGHQSQSWRWTPERAGDTLWLPAMSYRVSARTDDGLHASEPLDTETGVEGGPAVLDLVLTGRPGIKGRLVLGADEPEGIVVQVHALRFDGTEPPSASRLKEDGKSEYVEGGPNATYRFDDLEPGRYLIGAGRFATDITRTHVVTVGSTVVTRDLELPPLERDEYVVIKPLDPDGKPLRDVDITLGYASDRMNSSMTGGHVVRHADGTIWAFHTMVDQQYRTKEGRHYVGVKSERYGERSMKYLPSDHATFEVRFAEPGELVVTVAGAAGHPARDQLRVDVSQPAAEGDEPSHSSHEQATLDQSGNAHLGPLVPGRYRVSLSLANAGYGAPTAESDVEIVSGKNTASLTVPRLSRLTVAAPSFPSGQFDLWQKDADGKGSRWFATGALDEHGSATSEFVPDGSYKVTVRLGEERDSREIEVPATTDVRFE